MTRRLEHVGGGAGITGGDSSQGDQGRASGASRQMRGSNLAKIWGKEEGRAGAKRRGRIPLGRGTTDPSSSTLLLGWALNMLDRY